MAKVVTQTLFNQGVIEVSSRRLPQVGKNPSTAKLPESLKLTRPFTILYITFKKRTDGKNSWEEPFNCKTTRVSRPCRDKLTRPFTILYISFQIEKGKKKKIN